MNKYIVPLVHFVMGYIEVEAESLDDAIKDAENKKFGLFVMPVDGKTWVKIAGPEKYVVIENIEQI